ncbi:MAG: efflux RND transporter permease subunit [Proteobacteria bacterium]|nr:efflux RND transporter permease subunit [Pseudomonadota bacterium]
MNITEISIKRPAFISSLMIAIITVGYIAFKKMNVELFPNIDIPIIFIATRYDGAAPSEIESLVTKPLEEEISTVSGIKKLLSRSMKDTSQIIVQLYQNTDIKYAEQQIRDKINQARPKLPEDIKEPIIRRVDPSDQPVLTVILKADLSESELFDLADNFVRPRLEQTADVGMVEILGARKREIQILVDQNKLKSRDVSLSQINRQLALSGQNVSIGKRDVGDKQRVFRSASEFNEINQIENTLVNFYSNEIPTKVSDIGVVIDGLEDENSRAYLDGKKSLFLTIYRQSDANIIKAVDGVKVQIEKIKKDFASMQGKPEITSTKDASVYIRSNIFDIQEAVVIAITLTVLTVLLFLGSIRATIITAISLPITLIGAFIIMYSADFSINVITMLALSLAVGLLVDDAIVVVENIYRKIESGMNPIEASIASSREILMAVVAISAVVISVFTPISFLKGTVGQYLKQFGLTISFAMMISLIVAISIIPVLCAYLSGQNKKLHKHHDKKISRFDAFQLYLEDRYEGALKFSIKHPAIILISTLLIIAGSIVAFTKVPKTFMTESDNGEITVSLELSADSSLDATSTVALKIDEIVRQNKEVFISAASAGTMSRQANRGELYIKLLPKKERNISTSQFKEKLRAQIKDFSYANPVVKDFDPSGGASRGQPFNLFLISNDKVELDKYASLLFEKLKQDPRLKDVDTSNKATRPEFKVKLKEDSARKYGVNSQAVGNELRGYVEGFTPTKLRQNGLEYNIRVRLKPEQRDIKDNFNNIYVPNLNNKLIRLADIAKTEEDIEPATINRQDRGRYIQITASLAPKIGLGNLIADYEKQFKDGELKMPNSVRFSFSGDSENMQDMISSMNKALLLSIVFIYLILTSLYESFVVPFTILLALPLAFCGAFYALYITGESVNIFTMLGIFMLVSVSGKNSILLIDFTNRLIDEGKSRTEALIIAGRVRLRPILMTSIALIVGTLPVAIGFTETASMRTSMGVAIIGGLISSTLLTLVVVPAVFSYIDRFRIWIKAKLWKMVE